MAAVPDFGWSLRGNEVVKGVDLTVALVWGWFAVSWGAVLRRWGGQWYAKAVSKKGAVDESIDRRPIHSIEKKTKRELEQMLEDGELKCPICFEPPKTAVETSCGHTYCARCLSQIWKHKAKGVSGIVACPLDKKRVTHLLSSPSVWAVTKATADEIEEVKSLIDDYNDRGRSILSGRRLYSMLNTLAVAIVVLSSLAVVVVRSGLLEYVVSAVTAESTAGEWSGEGGEEEEETTSGFWIFIQIVFAILEAVL
mmetsp:Transcript_11439/g.30264  ORF Transcript_11439/g.30264 Transcript_11439/m.30264 type:complete len:253 (-) Transcript_11439:3617-4375(-)